MSYRNFDAQFTSLNGTPQFMDAGTTASFQHPANRAALRAAINAGKREEAISMLDEFEREIAEEKKPLLLRHLVANAVAQDYDGERLTFEEKEKRSNLARKILAGGTQDYTSDEITLIKRLCAQGQGNIVVGQIAQHIEKDVPPPDAASA